MGMVLVSKESKQNKYKIDLFYSNLNSGGN